MKLFGVETPLVTGEWTFRTTTGRATVADGRLELSGSFSRTVHQKWREGWTRNDARGRLLFLFSALGTAWFLARAVRSLRAALAGSANAASLVVLALVGFAVLAVARRTTRTRTVELQDVEVVRRVDHDRLRVEREGDHDALHVETPTEDDADEALEMLRLRGVPVEQAVDSDVPTFHGFRERLRAKED